MQRSVRMLLARSVDYAGLFPPAGLPMPDAVAEYAGLRAGSESWLVARFVCPAGRLTELVQHRHEIAGPGPLIIAALATGGADEGEFAAALEDDAEAMREFLGAVPRTVRIDQFEFRLPAAVVHAADPARTAALILATDAVVAKVLRGPVLLAAETPLAGRPRTESVAAAAGVARAVAGLDPGTGRSTCLKVRLGGPDAGAFPSAAEVAAAVAAARDHGIGLKATQGLHHALPGRDEATGAARHGFVNLLLAGVLARSAGLAEERVAALLEEADAAAFGFEEESVSWSGYRAELAAIATGRREGISTFGSCSVAEPITDLRTLGLLT